MTKKEANKAYYLKNKDKVSAKMKEYYQKNKEIIKKRTKKWYWENRDKDGFLEKIKERSKKSYIKNSESKREWHVRYWAGMRKELIDFMGGKCVECGYSDIRALQIDHVNGGGRKEYQENKSIKSPKLYKKHISKNKKNYQLLCANCYWIKRHEKKEYRSVKKSSLESF